MGSRPIRLHGPSSRTDRAREPELLEVCGETFCEHQLPVDATMSIDVDILPIAREPQFTGWCLNKEDLCAGD